MVVSVCGGLAAHVAVLYRQLQLMADRKGRPGVCVCEAAVSTASCQC